MSDQRPRTPQRGPRDSLMRGPSWVSKSPLDGPHGYFLGRLQSCLQGAQNGTTAEELSPLDSPNTTAKNRPSVPSTSRPNTAETPVETPPFESDFDSDEDRELQNSSIFIGTLRGNLVTGTVNGTVNMSYNEPSKLIEQLKASLKADYRYYPDGDEMALHRICCIQGTRQPILRGIIEWAINPSADSATVFWLAGPAGTGKTTIANTICHELDSVVGNEGGKTVIGGSFFCSRQFPETRNPNWIVRTIVYQLAIKSKAFRAALLEGGRFETVDHGPKSQLMALLVEPWKKSALVRLAENEPAYVVPIDALDELERERGSEFLHTLFNAVKDHQLSGLKFFVTSRLDHDLVKEVESFHDKQVCRLEQVPLEETNADIQLFLEKTLGTCATKEQILQLVSDAAGLFIYAATVVEYVKGRDYEEQMNLLGRLIAASPSPAHRSPRGATATLDNLYIQILEASLVDARDQGDPDAFRDCLSILHTFLCTVERTSTSVAVEILNRTRDKSEAALHNGDAKGILRRLHAVLYVKGGQVMWFHKSFPDFMFDKARSQRFFCDQDQHHRHLLEGCFWVMDKQLHFNMADITSSYELDCDNRTLENSISTNISDVLRYVCRSWTGHLTLTPRKQADRLLVLLNSFLQLQFLFWVEVMNLLGHRGRCQGMLRDARNWVAKDKKTVGCFNDLADAGAFAMYHNASGATWSTPHLYISSLATFPRPSALLRQWKQHFKGIPQFANAPGATVQALLSSFVAESKVLAVAVAPDGITVAIGASSRLHIWDLSTGEKLMTLEGHTDTVRSVAFSPDSTQLVSCSRDRSIRIWDLWTGEEVKTFEGHTKHVTSVAFSPDGAWLVSGSYDHSARVWETSTGKEVKILQGHTDPISSVAFSPDGTQIVSGSYDRSIRVWDISTGEEMKTFKGHTSRVTSVAFSPDGTQLVSGSWDRSVRVWDLSVAKEVKTFKGHTKYVSSVAFSPDGTQLVSGSEDHSVRVWDLSTGRETKILDGHTDSVTSVTFSPDGAQLVSGSEDRSIRVWDLSAREEEKTSEGHVDGVVSMAFCHNGTQLVSISWDHSICVWDLATRKEVKTFRSHITITSAAFSPDGTQLVSGLEDNSVHVWDTLTGEEVKAFEGHTGLVASVAFSSDSNHLVSGSHDYSVRVWDMSIGEAVKVFEGHTDAVSSVAFSPDGTQVVSGSWDHSVCIWDLLTGEEAKTFEGHTGWVNSVAFSPDGTQVVSGSDDRSVRIWDLLTGAEVKTFKGHVNVVFSVSFSPDGTQVVSGSEDMSIRVWDLLTGEEMQSFEGHTNGVGSVAFVPNGTQVVSCSEDRSVRIWHCSTEQTQLRYIRQKTLEGDHTGWLLSSSGYLMFVPLPAHLPDDSNILTVPSMSVPKLDLSKAKLGDRWSECYTPMSM